jgi:hypothetical protein
MTNPFAAKSCTALYAQELAGTSENGPAIAGTARATRSDATTKNIANFLIFAFPPLGN